jgi:hypothetical protein
MSRTKKGGRPVGYEYWSKRLPKFKTALPGRITKDITHSIERAEERRTIRKELEDALKNPVCSCGCGKIYE